MKLTRFFQPVVSAVLLAVPALQAAACGPYIPTIPTPEYFGIAGQPKSMASYDREENLCLWQELTSAAIPLSDIEQAVYNDPKERLQEEPCNSFYAYLENTSDNEITEFLYTAKTLEEQRAEFSSPWYYPRERSFRDIETGEFREVIDDCRHYTGRRLRDRYALQAVRALFASRQYEACVAYADSAFAGFPDSNLMKRMAMRYVAGCHVRFGNISEADSIFALSGDILSLSGSGSERIAAMARYNPAAPQLIEYIRSCADDTVMMLRTIPVANRLLKDRRVTCRGDWNFFLAFVSCEYASDIQKARERIRLALQQRFSTDELRDLARAYRMLLDAKAGDMSTLLADLRWMERKFDPADIDAPQWLDRCRDIIYSEWVPLLWKRKDYTAAIMLCAYADYADASGRMHSYWVYASPRYSIIHQTTAQMRDSEIYFNDLDYSSFSFLLMQSCTSRQLASAYARMMDDTPLYRFLRRKMRPDSDYYYDIIGTLALREGRYDRAETYFSLVSPRYFRTLNVDKDRYLSRDPFSSTPRDAGGASLVYDGSRWSVLTDIARPDTISNSAAKLDFARRMKKYGQLMKYGATPDDRGLARLMYALGRKNSFLDCWALTHYWDGDFCGVFDPVGYRYWEDDEDTDRYSFIYYDRDYDKDIAEYDAQVAEALAMLTTDEARAKAQYVLGNLKTIARRYPATTLAETLRTTCDHWSDWL